MPVQMASKPIVNIVDIGCGYGGLLYNLSPYLGIDELALGMEIRDKVSVFVSDKIKTLRVNSGHKEVFINFVN
jgi:tRNA (guanine-N7-)-methyltransferase